MTQFLRLPVLLVAAALGCGKHPTTSTSLSIPATTAVLVLDGELGEPAWSTTALRHEFVSVTGEQARPFSEVRWLHDARNLYVGLYAADEDIRSTEFFEVQIGTLALHANASGTITPTVPGITAAIDRDGTVDDPSNDDEEWVLEIAIPLATLDFTRGQTQTVRAARCDTPKDRIERCGSWAANVRLE